MNTRPFGRTGMQVSEVGLGLWGMGGWSGSDDGQSRQSLQLACDLGCNFFDTAWAYGNGHSSRLLGELVSANRDKQLIVAGKVPPKNLKWPSSPTDSIDDVFPVEHVIAYAEREREAMQVDSIDVLQYHVWDDGWTQTATFERGVSELSRRGLMRAFGLSLNRWEPWNGLKAIKTGLIDCVQVIYNIFDQAPEDELFPLCAEKKIGVIARVPLDEGSLGGKLTLDTTFPVDDFRAKYFGPNNLPETVRRVEAIRKILPPGLSLPQAALRFILSNPVVSTVIVGMRDEKHVRENMATSAAGPLDRGLLDELKHHRWDRKVVR